MYNKAEIYEQKIAPLVANLKRACYREGIPMFFCAAIRDTEKGMAYQNEMVSFAVVTAQTDDDRIAKLVNVIMGYDVVPHEPILEMEFGEDLDLGSFAEKPGDDV